MTAMWCSLCAKEMPFETVPCADGHGADCPDLLCVECGCVVVVAAVVEAGGGARRVRAA